MKWRYSLFYNAHLWKEVGVHLLALILRTWYLFRHRGLVAHCREYVAIADELLPYEYPDWLQAMRDRGLNDTYSTFAVSWQARHHKKQAAKNFHRVRELLLTREDLDLTKAARYDRIIAELLCYSENPNTRRINILLQYPECSMSPDILSIVTIKEEEELGIWVQRVMDFYKGKDLDRLSVYDALVRFLDNDLATRVIPMAAHLEFEIE